MAESLSRSLPPSPSSSSSSSARCPESEMRSAPIDLCLGFIDLMADEAGNDSCSSPPTVLTWRRRQVERRRVLVILHAVAIDHRPRTQPCRHGAICFPGFRLLGLRSMRVTPYGSIINSQGTGVAIVRSRVTCRVRWISREACLC